MSWTLENDLLEAEGNVVTLRGEGLGLGSLVSAMWVEADTEDGAAVQCWRFQVSAANRLIGEVVQSRRRPLLGPSPG